MIELVSGSTLALAYLPVNLGGIDVVTWWQDEEINFLTLAQLEKERFIDHWHTIYKISSK